MVKLSRALCVALPFGASAAFNPAANKKIDPGCIDLYRAGESNSAPCATAAEGEAQCDGEEECFAFVRNANIPASCYRYKYMEPAELTRCTLDGTTDVHTLFVSDATLPPTDPATNDGPPTPDCPEQGLCEGDSMLDERWSAQSGHTFTVCDPPDTPDASLSSYFPHQAPKGPSYIVVVSNIYVGCNAGRREASTFAFTAQQVHAEHPNVVFFTSLKGGSNAAQCIKWSKLYNEKYESGHETNHKQPYTIDDSGSEVRDLLFLPPYPHPSYAIIDHHGIVRHKFAGPCFGKEGYNDCSDEEAFSLDTTLRSFIDPLLDEVAALYPEDNCVYTEWGEWSECECDQGSERTRSRALLLGGGDDADNCESVETESSSCAESPRCGAHDCKQTDWGAWSTCSERCGGGGQRYRTRATTSEQALGGAPCGPAVEYGECVGEVELAPCAPSCVPALGPAPVAELVSTALSPRDLEFSPFPGRHVGSYERGTEYTTQGEELWVADGGAHAFSVVVGVGTEAQAALTVRDRGYYHYMSNVTSLAFSQVSAESSGRLGSFDTQGYVATCQDNRNTYLNTKEANDFQGPTLYNTEPSHPNLVARDGSDCERGTAECFLLHSDMLHESPECPAIAHDPEVGTAYGLVYWAVDGMRGHLVRYDFQQPHGPGLMDHSIAAVRRYPEVKVARGPPGRHQGMVLDGESRTLYLANPGAGNVLFVHADTGSFAREARTEFQPFSNRLPSFEYSVYECVSHGVFAAGLDEPSGLVLSPAAAGARLMYVAEFTTSSVRVYDLASASLVASLAPQGLAAGGGLSGLTLSPTTGTLYAASSESGEIVRFVPTTQCVEGEAATGTEADLARYLPVRNGDYVEPPSDPYVGAPQPVLNPVTYTRVPRKRFKSNWCEKLGEFEPGSPIGEVTAGASVVLIGSGAAKDAATAEDLDLCAATCDGNGACTGFNYSPPRGRAAGLCTLFSCPSNASNKQRYQRSTKGIFAYERSGGDVCVPDGTIPDSSLFEQVHDDTGYGSDDEAVQNDNMMDESASLLAGRTDCAPDSELNFDALLLGGFYCHACLPDPCAEHGGMCENVQWQGYVCDNTWRIAKLPDAGIGEYTASRAPNFGDGPASTAVASVVLMQGRTYRFEIDIGSDAGDGVYLRTAEGTGEVPGTATKNGVLEFTAGEDYVDEDGKSHGVPTELRSSTPSVSGNFFLLTLKVETAPPTPAPTSEAEGDAAFCEAFGLKQNGCRKHRKRCVWVTRGVGCRGRTMSPTPSPTPFECSAITKRSRCRGKYKQLCQWVGGRKRRGNFCEDL